MIKELFEITCDWCGTTAQLHSVKSFKAEGWLFKKINFENKHFCMEDCYKNWVNTMKDK